MAAQNNQVSNADKRHCLRTAAALVQETCSSAHLCCQVPCH